MADIRVRPQPLIAVTHMETSSRWYQGDPSAGLSQLAAWSSYETS
jgi:hypothetical protein